MEVIRHDADHMDHSTVRFARSYEAIENFFAKVMAMERISIAALHIDRDMPSRSFDGVGIEWQALLAASGHGVLHPFGPMKCCIVPGVPA
jgi:hypothetical protein